MKKTLLIAAIIIGWFGWTRADYIDDIYYNPKKEKSTQKTTVTETKKVTASKTTGTNTGIVDFSTMDVDEYNNRNYYYSSPVDTIGYYMESEPDFVYTTQIQKYYNPTIVVDNSDLLNDVLNNSYGNIDIVYNYTGPTFVSWAPYSYSYYWPYYSSYYYNPWNWGWGVAGWTAAVVDSWLWGPSWSWSWAYGPGWGWTRPFPSWGWHYHGPSWSWNRPGYPPYGYRPGYGYANYRPGGRQPFNSNPGPAGRPGGGNYAGSRPNSNHNMGVAAGPSNNARPVTTQPVNGGASATRPVTAVGGNSLTPSQSGTQMTRPSTGTTVLPSTNTTVRPSTNTTVRPSTNTTVRPSTNTTVRPSTTPTVKPSTNTTVRPSTNTTVKPSSTVTTRPTTTTTKPSTTTTTRPSAVTTTRPSTTTTTKPSTSTTRPSTSTTTTTRNSSVSRPSVSTGGTRGGFSGSSSGSHGSFGGGARGGRR